MWPPEDPRPRPLTGCGHRVQMAILGSALIWAGICLGVTADLPIGYAVAGATLTTCLYLASLLGRRGKDF